MKEIILCKYGEIVLKGLNKKQFEVLMLKQIARRVAAFGHFNITSAQSVAYIEPLPSEDEFGEEPDIDGAVEAIRKIFGIVSVSRAAVTEKNVDAIIATAKDYIIPALKSRGCKTFKVEGKRGDKTFPLTSPRAFS